MPQLILVRIDQDDLSSRLTCTIANEYDPGTQTVILAEPIQLNQGETPTIFVPRDACYEFDERVLQDVNGLVSGGLDKLAVAHKIMRLALVPATFEETEQPPPVLH